MWALFFVSVVIIGIANGFGKAQARKNQQALNDKEILSQNNDLELKINIHNESIDNDSIKQKLNQLNSLYKDHLISTEEYETKRSEILKNL